MTAWPRVEIYNNNNAAKIFSEYSVSMDYFLSPNEVKPDLANRIKIKVVPLQISISNLGEGQKDFFVELSDDSNYDMDISNWQLLLQKTVLLKFSQFMPIRIFWQTAK